MHDQGIVHRDIKPPNILLDSQKNLKLIDFGLGNFYGEQELLKTPCGSPCYAAPELICGEDYDPQQVDVWSCGITLFYMLFGRLPFDEDNKDRLYDKIIACSYKMGSGASSGASRLLKRIFVRDPKKRLNLNFIIQEKWFQGGGPLDGCLKPSEPTFDLRLILLCCHHFKKVDVPKMTELLKKHQKREETMTYYLLLKKQLETGLTEGELEIISDEEIKYKESLKSTEACLSQCKQGTTGTKKKSPRRTISIKKNPKVNLREVSPSPSHLQTQTQNSEFDPSELSSQVTERSPSPPKRFRTKSKGKKGLKILSTEVSREESSQLNISPDSSIQPGFNFNTSRIKLDGHKFSTQ